jgi:hypothetical protein
MTTTTRWMLLGAAVAVLAGGAWLRMPIAQAGGGTDADRIVDSMKAIERAIERQTRALEEAGRSCGR